MYAKVASMPIRQVGKEDVATSKLEAARQRFLKSLEAQLDLLEVSEASAGLIMAVANRGIDELVWILTECDHEFDTSVIASFRQDVHPQVVRAVLDLHYRGKAS